MVRLFSVYFKNIFGKHFPDSHLEVSQRFFFYFFHNLDLHAKQSGPLPPCFHLPLRTMRFRSFEGITSSFDKLL